MKHIHLLKKFSFLAENYLKQKQVLDIQFSGSTYQVEVFDELSNTLVYPFLQFSQDESLKDYFCSCDQLDNQGDCVHSAIALLAIYNKHTHPLHIRFENSFWNQICKIACDQVGYESELLTKIEKGHYLALNSQSECVFEIKAKDQRFVEKLYRWIDKRAKETEETSLKFSNLSPEEILFWKEGRPSPQLRYELSFWSDLAKWLMSLQEKHLPCVIKYEEVNGLPLKYQIEAEGLNLFFYVSSIHLPLLIPTFDSVIAPLKVYQSSWEDIEAITYDSHQQAFVIQKKPKEIEVPIDGSQAESIDQWIYVADKGFYPKEGLDFLKKTTISKNEIGPFLDKHLSVASSLFTKTYFHPGRYHLNYTLSFDREWNLHISSYLFLPSDISSSNAVFFDHWLYVEEKGFFHLHENLFNEFEKVVQAKDISSFVNQNRIWLNLQNGFQTHISSLETQLSYTVTTQGNLKFFSRSQPNEDIENSKDFGEWIYFKGEGFYSKLSTKNGFKIRPGLEIVQSEVSSFIKANRDELESLPQFFLQECPLSEVGLKIFLKNQNTIHVHPHYVFQPKFQDYFPYFFGDFVFVKDWGFYEIPHHLRLPERYQHNAIIGSDLINFFIHNELESLRKWALSVDKRLKIPQKIELETDLIEKSANGRLRLSLYFRTELGRVYINELLSALKKNKRYFFSDAGLIDLHDERFHWLKRPPFAKANIDPVNYNLEVSVLEFLRLEALQQLHFHSDLLKQMEQQSSFIYELRTFKTSFDPFLYGLKSELRPYQKTGLRWLWFLYQNGLSGLLCDDMGLGKTHQAMALIAAIRNISSNSKKFLVVCPTSVIYHWQEKLKLFFPEMKVLVFHGLRRNLDAFEGKDLLLTSYGILRSEKDALKEIAFDLAIYDEIQVAKNAQSRVHLALLAINAKMKLGLSGTPIENNLRELKSLFDLVLKGFMPSDAIFKEFFIFPIERENNHERKHLLSQLVKPFILRRKKIEVLQELPEKIEEDAYCELSQEQIHLYNDILKQKQQAVVSNLKNNQTPISYVHVFALLTALKQICDHPALWMKEPQNYKKYTSGKWDLFVELIDEAKASNQKVVVFTQYLQMLDIMELHLKEHDISYAHIRGETLKRSEELERFQQDPNCTVFIGSLQAAGLGIDLTAASIVIHYDRWWNAARENQATDRVHRIGQKRGVQVFRLIAKNTFEEKIDALIKKKGQLMEDIIQSDNEDQIKRFTREELIDLLSFLPSDIY